VRGTRCSLQARLSRKSATTAVCCRILQRRADVSASPTLIRRTAEADGVTYASSLGIPPTPSSYATASGGSDSAGTRRAHHLTLALMHGCEQSARRCWPASRCLIATRASCAVRSQRRRSRALSSPPRAPPMPRARRRSRSSRRCGTRPRRCLRRDRVSRSVGGGQSRIRGVTGRQPPCRGSTRCQSDDVTVRRSAATAIAASSAGRHRSRPAGRARRRRAHWHNRNTSPWPRFLSRWKVTRPRAAR
jgi:hypothetical protein